MFILTKILIILNIFFFKSLKFTKESKIKILSTSNLQIWMKYVSYKKIIVKFGSDCYIANDNIYYNICAYIK